MLIDYYRDAGSVTLSKLKHVQKFLEIHDLTECKPAPTPHTVGHGMEKNAPDNEPLSEELHPKYLSALGIARSISGTVGHKIAYITSALAAYQDKPSAFHYDTLKIFGRYL